MCCIRIITRKTGKEKRYLDKEQAKQYAKKTNAISIENEYEKIYM